MKAILGLFVLISLFSAVNASAHGHYRGGGYGYYPGYRPIIVRPIVPVVPVYPAYGYYNPAPSCVPGPFCGYDYYGNPRYAVVCSVWTSWGWQQQVRGCY